MNKLNKILGIITGLLYGVAIGLTVINFIEKPTFNNALFSILILVNCGYILFRKDNDNSSFDLFIKDLKIRALELKIAGLKSYINTLKIINKI